MKKRVFRIVSIIMIFLLVSSCFFRDDDTSVPETVPAVTAKATSEPKTKAPTVEPTVKPTAEPTVKPTAQITVAPTEKPKAKQTEKPNIETKATSAPKNSNTVYITPTGKRYHYSPECAGKNGTPTTLSHAREIGLTPCKKCAQ